MYKHSFCLEFEVKSEMENGVDVPEAVILAAMEEQVRYLKNNPDEIWDEVGESCKTSRIITFKSDKAPAA